MNENRREFLRRMNSELDSIDGQLDQYRAGLRDAPAKDARLDAIEQRRQEIRRRSEELENFAGDDWESMRREIETARDDLRRAVDETRNPTRH